jgi:hypothetical protein
MRGNKVTWTHHPWKRWMEFSQIQGSSHKNGLTWGRELGILHASFTFFTCSPATVLPLCNRYQSQADASVILLNLQNWQLSKTTFFIKYPASTLWLQQQKGT